MRSFFRWASIVAAAVFLVAGCGSDAEPTARRTTQALCSADCSPYACNDTSFEPVCYDWCQNDFYCADGAHCVDDTCVGEAGGDCTLYAPNPDGGCNTWCARDSDCTQIAYCDQSSGACVPDLCVGKTVDDGNPCTTDACDRTTGLITRVNLPQGANCPDQTACNGMEKCDGQGHCNISGTPVVTDDGKPCTVDSCDPITGVVSHTGALNACGDGSTRYLSTFAGTGSPLADPASVPFGQANFNSPGGLAWTFSPIPGGPPYYSKLVSDTGNNQIRVLTNAGTTRFFDAVTSANLLKNPGCDESPGSAGVVAWENETPISSARCNSTLDDLQLAPFDGARYIALRAGESIHQDVPLVAYSSAIDSNLATFTFDAYSAASSGSTTITLQYLSSTKTPVGLPVTFQTANSDWTRAHSTALAPSGARFLRVALVAGIGASSFDGLSLVNAPSPTLNRPLGIAYTPDSLLVANSYADTVDSWSFVSGHLGRSQYTGLEAPTDVKASQDQQTYYFADYKHHRISRFSYSDHAVKVFAGNGTRGATGDGGAALNAQLNYPSGIAVDAGGNVYIADSGNATIRKVSTGGTITTVAGVAGVKADDGDGLPATSAHFIRPTSLAFGNDNVLYVVDTGAHRIRKVKDGVIYGLVGSGHEGDTASGNSLLAELREPTTIALNVNPADPSLATQNELLIADTGNHKIKRTTCDDSNVCNGPEVYNTTTALCGTGTPPNLDDGKYCTADTCTTQGGIKHTNLAAGTNCADGNPCNGAELCDGQGECAPGIPQAEDNNPCTNDFCDLAAGEISHTPNPGAVCSEAACVAGAFTGLGICSSSGQCIVPPAISCGLYACQGMSCAVSCSSDANCGASAFCNTQLHTCMPNQCPTGPFGNNPCRTYTCDPATGTISSVPKEEGAGCPDGNLCNGDEKCTAGVCAEGTPKAISDHNPCTTDACIPATGVVTHLPQPDTTLCEDGNACNGVEHCASGLCVPGTALVVDDSDPCTADFCDNVSGVTNQPLPEGAACGPTKTCQSGTCAAPVAPDPAINAPALNVGVATTIQKSLDFLTSTQTGLSQTNLQPGRVALVRGYVKESSGSPLAGVKVSIIGRPEFGSTLTTAQGEYNLVVNGGGFLRVSFTSASRLPAERTVQVAWNEYKLLGDVALVSLDDAVTPVDLDEAGGHAAVGSLISDQDGSRTASVYFPANTHALLVGPTGALTPVTQLSVRATEFTVGTNGPASMPGSLPPTSAYTYAVELSLDEALAVNAQGVQFDQPVPFYIDNFLSIPVGKEVPVGYYDRKIGAWIPADNGLVIKVIAVDSGIATIDTTGDDLPESDAVLLGLGITTEERQSLAQTRAAGTPLWRFATRHFTPFDCNWPYSVWTCAQGGPCEGDAPAPPKVSADPGKCQSTVGGSIVECQAQVLRETLPIPGTPFSLNYRSGATPGYQATSGLDIQVVNGRIPERMASAEVGVFVGGRGKFVHFQKDTLTPNFAYHYSWDGRDAFGREMQGRQAATVIVSHQYNPPYADPDTSAQAILFATYPSGSQVSTSRDADQYSVSWTYDVPVGQLKDPPASLGGWLVSEHMHYDVGGRRLLTGYGEEIAVDALTGTTVPRTVEKYTNYANDNSRLTPLAVGANGEVYLVEPSDNGRIKRLNPDGSLTRISGTHNGGITDQDGAPASTAFVGYNLGLAVAPDGSLLYADRDSHRVRRITPDGVVHTIAGKVGAPTFVSGGVQFYDPSSGYTGDGGPASAATLCSPTAVTAAPDGTIYIWDSGNNVIRRVNSAGMISTVVGTGAPGYGGARPADGLPGRQVSIYQSGTSSNHLAVSPDGSVYFDSHYQYTVLSRLGTDGRVHYVTGDRWVQISS